MKDLRGGYRFNSGRKRLGKDEKRIPVQTYIPKKLKEKIEKNNINGIKTLSKKCSYLISKGFKNEMSKNNNCVRFVDLFAGLGGIRVGFEQALKDNNLKGVNVFTSEIKKSAIKVYKQNFGSESNINGDLTKIKEDDIPDFDYLLAGFPCQSFSTAGKQLGFKDTRGTLFFDIARIIKRKKPSGFLLENVENLLTHDHGKTFEVIYNTLKDLGYSVGYKVLSSKDFGLAQNRKRIYIIGNKNKQENSILDNDINMENLENKQRSTLKDIIDYSKGPVKDDFSDKLLKHFSISYLEGKSIKDKRGGANNIHSWEFGLRGEISNDEVNLLNSLLKERRKKHWAKEIGIQWMDGMPLTERMISTFFNADNLHEMLIHLVKMGYLKYEYPKKRENNVRIYDKSLRKGYNIVTGKLSFEYSKILSHNEVTPTLVATDMSKLAVPINGGLRPLTIREGLRLFGFPDWYRLDDVGLNKSYDLLGNTVCVPVIRSVANRLLNS